MVGRLTARWILGVSALCLVGPAEATDAKSWNRGVFTGHSPRPQAVAAAPDGAGPAAEFRDGFAVLGRGRSMHPLYPTGTLLVLRPVRYDELRRGQTVVYRSRAGRPVAHVLVTRTRDGWRARGLNNRRHDFEPVHAGNLLGVVVAAYAAPFPSGDSVRRVALFLSDD